MNALRGELPALPGATQQYLPCISRLLRPQHLPVSFTSLCSTPVNTGLVTSTWSAREARKS